MVSSRMIGDHDPLPVQLDEFWNLCSVSGVEQRHREATIRHESAALASKDARLDMRISSIQSPQQLCKWSLPSVLYRLYPVGSWPLPFSLGQSFDEVPLSEDGRNQQNHKGAVAASFLAAGITHSRRPLQLQTLERYMIYV